MSSASKLKVQDGIQPSVNLKNPDQRSNSLLCQLSTAEPLKSPVKKPRSIRMCTNAHATRQRTEETLMFSPPS